MSCIQVCEEYASTRDQARDRRIELRGRIMDVLREEGQAMKPAAIAARLGVGAQQVTILVQRFPTYFDFVTAGYHGTGMVGKIIEINIQRHLRNTP